MSSASDALPSSERRLLAVGHRRAGSESVRQAQHAVRTHHDRALDQVAELAHVAGPVVALERRQRLGGHLADRPSEARALAAREVLDEERDVLATLAQRRQPDRDDVQAVVEVLAEATRPHLGEQVAIARRHEAHVDDAHLRAAEPLHLALLDGAQELRLDAERQRVDVVEKERPAVGELEAAEASRRRAREGALLVAEELALEQGLGHRRARHLHQDAVGRAGSGGGSRAPPAPCRCRSRRAPARRRRSEPPAAPAPAPTAGRGSAPRARRSRPRGESPRGGRRSPRARAARASRSPPRRARCRSPRRPARRASRASGGRRASRRPAGSEDERAVRAGPLGKGHDQRLRRRRGDRLLRLLGRTRDEPDARDVRDPRAAHRGPALRRRPRPAPGRAPARRDGCARGPGRAARTASPRAAARRRRRSRRRGGRAPRPAPSPPAARRSRPSPDRSPTCTSAKSARYSRARQRGEEHRGRGPRDRARPRRHQPPLPSSPSRSMRARLWRWSPSSRAASCWRPPARRSASSSRPRR